MMTKLHNNNDEEDVANENNKPPLRIENKFKDERNFTFITFALETLISNSFVCQTKLSFEFSQCNSKTFLNCSILN